jgi:hypothetical protein
MKSFLTSIAAAFVLLSAPIVLAINPGPLQVSNRDAVRPYSDLLSPRIHDALLQVLEAEEELTQLIPPPKRVGEAFSPAEQQWHLNDPASPLKQYLDRHRARFDTHGLTMDVEGLRECIFYDAAFHAAAELVAEHPDLDTDEVLAAFTVPFVEGAPIWPTKLALELYDRSRQSHDLAHLGNGRALARLTWGLLQQKAWWSAGDRDRGALILGLIGCGFESRLVAQVVDLSLANGILPATDPTKSGHGVCAPHLPIAEDIGYDQRHEATLERDLELVTYLSTVEDPSGVINLDLAKVELLDGGRVIVTPNQLGHLCYWVPRRLELVRDELYQGEYREQLKLAMRQSTSLEQRQLFWQSLAASSDFLNLRLQVLDELRAMMAGETNFPQPERLRELLTQAEARALTEAEQQELESLSAQADQRQMEFINTLAGYLVRSGAHGNIDLLVTTLRDDLPELLQSLAASGHPGSSRLDVLLSDAWYHLATSKSPELNRVLEQALTGQDAGGIELPSVARDNLIWAATTDGGALASRNLNRVLEVGTCRDKAVALLNPQWANEATFSRGMNDLIQEAWSKNVDTLSRFRIEAYFSSSLATRPVTPASKDVLLTSLRDEHWASKHKTCYWGQAFENPERFSERLDLLRRYLSPQEIEKLTAEGLLPKGLL